MRGDHHVLICVLAVGLLMLAPLTEAGAAYAGPEACAKAIQAEAECCGADAPDPTGPSCQIACLCTPGLPGEAPAPGAAESDRLPAPAIFRLAERALCPDPLPPKPLHG